MIKFTYIFLFAFLSLSVLKAQIPSDSLPGIYAGQYWVANPATSPWIITPDTVFVSSIDSINCRVSIADADSVHFYGYPYYYTTYFSCTDSLPVYNHNTKFFNNDSLSIKIINEPQPPPQNPWSWCFFGKRISSINTKISELDNNNQLKIYPNPTNDNLTVEIAQKSSIEILTIEGQTIITIPSTVPKSIINLSSLSSGFYIIKVRTEKGVIIKKILKE